MAELPAPEPGDEGAWVARHLADLLRTNASAGSTEAMSPPRVIRGGQSAADTALDAFDVRGYAARRNEVWPRDRRGASRLSPYIRHGLLPLPRVWAHVEGGPARDVGAFRDELLWQEYARHLYARVGEATRRSLRFSVEERARAYEWPDAMRCVELATTELRDEGWIPNQMRMWLASQWSVRDGAGWRDGEDEFFRHLLDGSRAANRVGWQWTVGALTGKPYGFSRWQVEKRAPGVCGQCTLSATCPIEDWPPEVPVEPRAYVDPRMRRNVDAALAPIVADTDRLPEGVWITAESLGDDDPALAAHPELPVHFVWDIPLLQRLRLSAGRLIFLSECLADLARRRTLVLHRGDPVRELSGIPLAGTAAPVPGWSRRAEHLDLVEALPWPWLVRPTSGPVTSFTAWRRSART